MSEAILVRRSSGKKLPELNNPGTEYDLLENKQLIDQEGEIITGTIPVRTENDLSVDGPTISIPKGYYNNQINKSIETTDQAIPDISVDFNGLITASNTQNAGYIEGGTKSSTKQLTIKGATTVTPSTSEQTIMSAGVYTTGDIKVTAMPTVTRADTIISTSADDINDKLTITASNNQGTGYVIGANKTASKTITLTASGSNITASDGTNSISKSVTTATQATPSITVDSSGKITASATQTAGYVSAGTKSSTKQLTTKAATTITPSTSNQTVAAGTYLTGTLTVSGDADLKASNIKKGVNIFNIAGSYEGVELNYKVVGGTTQPSNPTENTIWVNTSTTITSHIFSSTKPTGIDGMVWIYIGTTSSMEFNALKTNGIYIYPIYVEQYINNTWVTKTIKIYSNSVWKDNDYIILGYDGLDTTISTFSVTRPAQVTVESGSNYLKISAYHSGSYASIFYAELDKTYDLTNYKTIEINVSDINVYGKTTQYLYLSKTSNNKSNSVGSVAFTRTGIHTLDISSITGSYYINFYMYGDSSYNTKYVVIDSIKLKR